MTIADVAPARTGAVDYLCNAFFEDRLDVWQAAISSSGIAVKVRSEVFGDTDRFLLRLDAAGVASVLLPTLTPSAAGLADPLGYDAVAATWDEMEALVDRAPGRFAALAVIDPDQRSAGARELTARLAQPWVVGAYLHTHSWDRRFDAADYYPFYAACAAADVPVVMQAGTSGGLHASECGQPIGIDRPALYFPEVRFVLSHLGWPWCEEAIAMSLKFPNVFLGTGSYPPSHWPGSIVSFVRGCGRTKVMWGTNFPTVDHGRALEQLGPLGLDERTLEDLTGATARRVFTRIR